LLRLSPHRAIDALTAARGWRAAWAWSLVAVIALRLALGVVMGCAWLAVRSYLPASSRVDPALSGGHAYGLLAEAALAVWPRWDAVHYLGLARLGYFGVGVGDTVFYPLYPAFVAVIAPLVAGDYLAAGLILSSLAAWVALAMLYRLSEQAFGPGAAHWSILALAVYPTALFLLAPYSESLFLALTLAAFAAAGERRWWLAGLMGALASLARGPGILTPLALACIAWRQRPYWRGTALANRLPPTPVMFGLLLPITAGVGFLLWRAVAGFPPVSSVLRQYSGLELVDPLRGLGFAIIQFVQVHDLPTSLDVTSALLFLAVLTAMIANPRWRKSEWIVYMSLNLVVFLSKRSLNAASLQSLARYVLALFPAFVVAGDWLSRRSQPVRFIYMVVSSTALLVLSAGYSLWWFIG
jgi:hypothetical protein